MNTRGISLLCICGYVSLISTQVVCGETELGDQKRTPTPASPIGYRGDGANRFTGATPPASWDAIKGDNVRWRVKLPSRKAARDKKGTAIKFTGSAQPVAFGDRVYVTAAPATLVCLQASDGKEVWRTDLDPSDGVPDGQRDRVRELWKINTKDSESDDAIMDTALRQELCSYGLVTDPDWRYTEREKGWMNLSPVTDGERIIVVSGQGMVASLGMDGKLQWIHLGCINARAPMLAGGRVVIPFEKTKSAPTKLTSEWGGGAYVVALDVATGKMLWKATWNHNMHHSPGHGVVVRFAGRDLFVVGDGSVFDGKDGSLWANVGYQCGLGGTPTLMGDRLAMPHGDYHAKPSKLVLLQFRDGPPKPEDSSDGEPGAKPALVPDLDGNLKPAETPTVPGVPPKAPTPGAAVVVKWVQTLPVRAPLDAGGGVVVFRSHPYNYCTTLLEKGGVPQVVPELVEPKAAYLDPVMGGNRVFLWDQTGNGRQFVVEGSSLKQVAVCPGPMPVAAPCFLGKRMFLRTMEELLCIAEAP